MRVPIEDHGAYEETRTFVDIQAQAVPRFNHVVHVHFRVAVFPVKNFEKKREVVRACGTQSKIFDCSDLLVESGAQVLFLERLLAAKFDDAGPLGAFFLLLHDPPTRSLSVFPSLPRLPAALSVSLLDAQHRRVALRLARRGPRYRGWKGSSIAC